MVGAVDVSDPLVGDGGGEVGRLDSLMGYIADAYNEAVAGYEQSGLLALIGDILNAGNLLLLRSPTIGRTHRRRAAA